ncbi:MAG: hypothetical protein HZC40_24000 [Chloroflexi bacterium]|nr:hypothetical protein [Chloroflexota bacterium]
MTLNEFEQSVFAVANRTSICETPTIRRLTPTSITIRVPLTTGGFVDAFFNQQTGTTAFALIQNDMRIFGADNTSGWHLHPFADPVQHQFEMGDLSFVEFIAMIENHYSN